jgi:hypothetical protein
VFDYEYYEGHAHRAEREGEETGYERNELVSSRDAAAVQYRYGADGKRAVKYNEKTGGEALYFNAMWDLAQVVTNWEGKIYERYEYTPYGEA